MSHPGHKRAFVAGASGAIGAILCRLLLEDGWHVVGTTRSQEKAARLKKLGVHPEVVDVFDRETLVRIACAAKPDIVVHQLSDLPKQFTAEKMAAARVRNARIREIGTKNLIDAAIAAGATRIVAQSIAFAYVPGSLPYSEETPLDNVAYPSVVRLEQLVLDCDLEGVALRYGRLYGPNTWTMVPPAQCPVHVDAAAEAARLSMTCGQTGVYNVVENDGCVTNARAKRELKWDPDFRCPWPT